MALLDFKGKAEAERWKGKLKDLNDRTDRALRNVGNTIDEIKTESAGAPVDQLVETAADLVDAAAEVIEGLKGLENAIQSIIDYLIQKIADAAQDVADDRAKATNL